MDFSCRCKIFRMLRAYVLFQFLLLFVRHVQSLDQKKFNQANQTTAFQPGEATQENLTTVRAHFMKINKPEIQTIKDLPKKSSGRNSLAETTEDFQLCNMFGKPCPERTVPIKGVIDEDILRSSSVSTFGRKTVHPGHEHAIVYVNDNQFYGAKASMNLWAPIVEDKSKFSLAQIWVLGGSFGVDLNSIEAGWQIYPQLYGDTRPRLFGYWTRDAYKTTGCYNFQCPGFVQKSKKVAFGSVIAPTSSYRGRQYEITLLIWKDIKTGNWWLRYGSELVGYWPSSLFTHLKDHATTIQFGGEIFNNRNVDGSHTSTQMGSGHFPGEGYGKASYFRNLQVVDKANNLITPANLQIYVDNPNCYDIKTSVSKIWGNFFYYGGPGRNSKCP